MAMGYNHYAFPVWVLRFLTALLTLLAPSGLQIIYNSSFSAGGPASRRGDYICDWDAALAVAVSITLAII